ncbi:MAG: hypothetical protein HOP37_10380 [Cyclobacteriaceae bacterium]|nr:hypothetical protein [Cyclobacteriaceae bacterium]
MKKIVASFFAFLFTLSLAYSQIKKGNMQFGGSLGYSRYSQDQSTVNQDLSSGYTN